MKPSPNLDTEGQKTQLREKLKQIRNQVTSDMAEMAALTTWVYLQTRKEFVQAESVAAFSSIQGEVNTLTILEGVLKLNKKLFLPRVSNDRSHLGFYEVKDLRGLAPGAFGILEPPIQHPARVEDLDMMILPGLAFDLKGSRLGFGKGFYDRILPRLKKSALSVGLCYSFQVIEKVPVTGADVPVKALLHENGFVTCSNR